MGLRLFIRKIFRGYSKRETPGSIPNPEAKALCADGTALLRVWESRLLPLYYSIAPVSPGLFLFGEAVRPPHLSLTSHQYGCMEGALYTRIVWLMFRH